VERFDRALAAARSGAEWGWTELYRQLSPPVLGYLRARGAQEPEDLLGEVFLQVVRDVRRFEGGGRDFRAWVFSIAHNRLLDDQRRRRRRPLEQPAADPADESERIGDLEDEVLEAISEQRLRQVLARLSPDQQSVLLLRIIGDLTIDQVAQVLGKRAGAVKALQRRGLAALAREISKDAVTL
jgi:RNA polymerase sigma factor (sigma-70 family)